MINARERIDELEKLNMINGLPFAKPFAQWSKQHQIEYNVLHEQVFRDGVKFDPVKDTDGVKYSELEIEEGRVSIQNRIT